MPETIAPTQESTIEAQSRRWLTLAIVLISVSGVVALAILALFVGSPTGEAVFERVKYVSATILPLLASWVGTILAFYFSKENFVAATQSVTDLSKTIAGMDKLKAIPVRDKMRSLSAMTVEQVPTGDESKRKLSDLLKKYSTTERIIILDDKNVVRFLIYKSMVERYLSRFATGAAAPPHGRKIEDLTLKDLLDSDAQMKQLFEHSFGFVAAKATLGDAKQEMDRDKCGDIFVTQTGNSSEPIIGWITDNTIMENAKI